MNKEEVKCPKCEWKPDGGAYWQCSSCHHIWNTFATYGQCPQCKKVYKDTQCIACSQWSPHADWYNDLENIKLDIKEKEAEETPKK